MPLQHGVLIDRVCALSPCRHLYWVVTVRVCVGWGAMGSCGRGSMRGLDYTALPTQQRTAHCAFLVTLCCLPAQIFIDDLREEFVRDYVFPMFR